jgi:hypothetical protein
MKLRIILLGILLLINSNLLLSQVFPLGVQIPNLYRSGYSNNIVPQQSISKKRSYSSSNREKLYSDSLINARTLKSNLSNNDIDTDNNSNKYNKELIYKVIKICNEDFNNFNYNKEI